jgi:N4-gp56 family major capsid protein
MQTNFGALTTEQLTAWSRDFWRVARNASFINKFAGGGPNSMVHKVTELTKGPKGTRAVLTLIAEMTGDGVTGDNTLEGNEEALRAYDMVVNIDQLRMANRNTGKLADQKSVVNFRETSRDVLAYAFADRIDQMAFLTLSGVSYAYKNNGALRVVNPGAGQNLSELEFAGDVTAPSTNRHLRWVASSNTLAAGATASVVATDLLTYRTIVELKAFAKDNYIRGIKSGSDEVYHMFVTPQQMAKLKLDTDFLANVRNAGVRGGENSLFAGTSSVMVDGVMIHEFRHVYNTKGAASGSKWGSGGLVNGARALFCGAQALAMADIGMPEMVEDQFDYANSYGISIGKIFGFKKPKFQSDYNNAVEDFGVICLDTAF